MNESYTFNLSILQDNPKALDQYEPVTFLVWFSNKAIVNFDINTVFDEYKKYIIAWGKKKALTRVEQTNIVRDSYIQVLRDIVINYATEEERRFITNADFSSESDLDVVLPFFIRKIKQVCLYYAGKREEVKTAAVQHNLRGSNYGIETLVKKLIFDAATTNQYYYSFDTNFFPPVSALARDIDIYVEELYDTSTNYFNISPKNSDKLFAGASTQRQQLSTANINDVNYKLYLDFKQAVIDAIRQYPFFLDSLGINNFTINPILSGTEYNYLKSRDFIDYVGNSPDKLKLTIQKALAPKYLANNFYYLSTGSTATNFVSGLLFSVTPPTGAPTLNLLNRSYPSTATVPDLNSLYSEYEIGKFFIPTYLGLLIYNTPKKQFSVNKQGLQANKVYVFPDPDVVGNVIYNSDYDDPDYPLVYEINVSWNKISRSNHFLFGDVLSNSYKQLYYGYESQQQDLQKNISGISKSEDNIQFWDGEKQQNWANSDIWPGLKDKEQFDYASRQNSLMVDAGTLVKWSSDIFNNEFGLYKPVTEFKSINEVANDAGIMPASNTEIQQAPAIANKNIFEKKNVVPGQLYFRNTYNNTVAPASAALAAIYKKYPNFVYDELVGDIYKFNIYGDVIILETKNYVVVDRISFNYETLSLQPTFNPGNYFLKAAINRNIEGFVNEWYAEEENNIYFCFVNLRPSLSASNYKLIYPTIYRCSIRTLQFVQIYPSQDANINSIYSLSAEFIDPPQIDIRKIDGAHFSRVNRTNTFDLTYLAKNNNGMPLFVSEQFIQTEPFLTTTTPKLFKPFYFIYDNNYANPALPFLVKYNASTSGIMGTHDENSTFDIGQKNALQSVYYFNDSISPTQINNTGEAYIQFDWQSFDTTTIFIGCTAFLVKNIDNKLIWNYNTPDAIVLNTFNQSVNVFNCEATNEESGDTFAVAVVLRRPIYPDPSVLEISIKSIEDNQYGIICGSPDSIYHTLNIQVSGNGAGIVYSEPFCYECGTRDQLSSESFSNCTDTFATNTSITLIAVPDRLSTFRCWLGGSCDGNVDTDCFFSVVSSQTITAVFDMLPIYYVTVFTEVGRVLSLDGHIDCPGICTYGDYIANDFITLSAINGLSGYEFKGFVGAPDGSAFNGRYGLNTCTFLIANNVSISANYIRYYDYNVNVTVASTSGVGIVNAGRVISTPAGIDCSSGTTANATFTGTPDSIYGSTNLTLSAGSVFGYQFKNWSGTPCSPATAPVCSFSVGQDYNNIIALFDLGYYTLTVNFSGNGVGTVFSDELGVAYTNLLSGESKAFSVLNGTTFFINVSAVSGTELIGMFGESCGGYTVSSCYITMNTNKTIFAALSSTTYFGLSVIYCGTLCGTVTSSDGRLNCGTICQAQYVQGNVVDLGLLPLSPGCTFEKFIGGSETTVYFLYQPGAGINMSQSNVTLSQGDLFALVDDSLIITNASLGADYKNGDGINMERSGRVIMAGNRVVSAFFV
jgi:hypothetical protein